MDGDSSYAVSATLGHTRVAVQGTESNWTSDRGQAEAETAEGDREPTHLDHLVLKVSAMSGRHEGFSVQESQRLRPSCRLSTSLPRPPWPQETLLDLGGAEQRLRWGPVLICMKAFHFTIQDPSMFICSGQRSIPVAGQICSTQDLCSLDSCRSLQL